jgi:hypothetical protein
VPVYLVLLGCAVQEDVRFALRMRQWPWPPAWAGRPYAPGRYE